MIDNYTISIDELQAFVKEFDNAYNGRIQFSLEIVYENVIASGYLLKAKVPGSSVPPYAAFLGKVGPLSLLDARDKLEFKILNALLIADEQRGKSQ